MMKHIRKEAKVRFGVLSDCRESILSKEVWISEVLEHTALVLRSIFLDVLISKLALRKVFAASAKVCSIPIIMSSCFRRAATSFFWSTADAIVSL